MVNSMRDPQLDDDSKQNCSCCDKLIDIEKAKECLSGEEVCSECIKKVKCWDCGEWVDLENTIKTEDGYICGSCINRHNVIEMLLMFENYD